MRLPSLLALVAVLQACTTHPAPPPRDPLAAWLAYLERVESLDADALATERSALFTELAAHPSDESRLKLAYLLSRSGSSPRDLGTSAQLLAEVSDPMAHAPIRRLITRDVSLRVELESAHAEAAALRAHVDELEARLEALKAIDADLAKDHQDIQELPQ